MKAHSVCLDWCQEGSLARHARASDAQGHNTHHSNGIDRHALLTVSMKAALDVLQKYQLSNRETSKHRYSIKVDFCKSSIETPWQVGCF